MQVKLLLSVIIVSYNTKELLKDCLDSIQLSIEGIEGEIFVVDNNSSDNTISLIKAKYKWVKLIENKSNLGFSKANNIAIKKAKGKYLLILNPDTKLRKDTISKMINFMQSRDEIAVTTCRVELPSGSMDRDCRRHFPTPWRAFAHFSGLSKIFSGSKIFDQYQMGYLSENTEHEVDSCVGAFMFIRASAIKKVGLFDEDFFFYGEDLDWCWRFKQLGYKIVYTPVTKIIHYKGAASGIKPPSAHLSKATIESKKRAVVESTRAMELFYQKHYTDKYPRLITWSVILSVKLLEKYRLFKISHSL
ncbi:MAG: WsbD [Candidatus Curtissbacteria bacterium GW2011_GWA1_41_11]|uniref:WsbD n=1 Tax=Candidatus Curtissbacteria bacterium GW2011_GWA1_41_11 TaxID=1618409 RepID=A0A0G0WUL7_9BACT|nr:MAG: WsbD [Candidatus Curtissbacteria bacterium GW2011_GWA1_41_11]